jgi:hypothetical protein
MLAVFEISYRRLSLSARLLLAYLSAFSMPFTRKNILWLFPANAMDSYEHVVHLRTFPDSLQDKAVEEINFAALAQNWRSARDELVRSSFMQFDGRYYSIHSQVQHFAFSLLPIDERRRIQDIIAANDASLDQPSNSECLT